MAGLGDLFGSGGTIEQLFVWGLLNQIIGEAGGPALELLTAKVNADHPVFPLQPPDLADAVVRSYMTMAAAAAEAAESGMNAERFQTIVHLHADAPAPGDLATALRRGLIPETGTGADSVSFDQGIREGRTGNKWTPMLKALAVQWPSPTDALDALLEGQISQQQAEDLYHKFGGDPQFFQMLFNTRGSAPTPLEASEMANRGIIPWDGQGPDSVSFHQSFLEGPWRDKWEDPYRKLAIYVPPESTVSTLLAHGAIDTQTAARLLAEQGMDKDTIAAYIKEAEIESISDYRGLTVSTVLDMVYAQLIADKDAEAILETLHVTPKVAQLLLSYVALRRSIAAVNTAVSRIGTLYAARKITRDAARQSLNALQIPGAQIESILGTWDIQNSVNVKVLTEAQIIDAWAAKVLNDDEALTELQNIGYTPFDSWVLMSIKAKAPLPGKPSQGPPPPQGAVVPGTT